METKLINQDIKEFPKQEQKARTLSFAASIEALIRMRAGTPASKKKIKSFRRKKSALFPFPRNGAGDLKTLSGTVYQIQADGSWKCIKRPE